MVIASCWKVIYNTTWRAKNWELRKANRCTPRKLLRVQAKGTLLISFLPSFFLLFPQRIIVPPPINSLLIVHCIHFPSLLLSISFARVWKNVATIFSIQFQTSPLFFQVSTPCSTNRSHLRIGNSSLLTSKLHWRERQQSHPTPANYQRFHYNSCKR